MDVSIAEAKNKLPELIRAVEKGEQVVITRHGKPVAQITPPPAERRKVQLGTMRGRIHRKPGWDRHLTEEEFLAGDF
jgi:prevent-host-death family protein